jgi:hypothetical protein
MERRLPHALAALGLLLLAACPSPTETAVEIDSDLALALAPGERIVLFPGLRRDADRASHDFARCVRDGLTERGTPAASIMDSGTFQDALYPWFEAAHAPQTAAEMDQLLARPKVRERVEALKVHYLVSLALGTDAEGFPGMLCGASYAGAGCLGAAWEGKTSKLDAVVWDLQSGAPAGDISASSSGTSLSLGVIVPIVFVAYTEAEACEALAAELAAVLDGG